MDDVLREAVRLPDPDHRFGPQKPLIEYRFGELFEGESEGDGPPRPPEEPPPAQPGLSS
jgi:hypothetical protein